jgi:hypothetical protein
VAAQALEAKRQARAAQRSKAKGGARVAGHADNGDSEHGDGRSDSDNAE